eukprot:3625033-Prymnesium_polylepis.1
MAAWCQAVRARVWRWPCAQTERAISLRRRWRRRRSARRVCRLWCCASSLQQLGVNARCLLRISGWRCVHASYHMKL